MVPEADGQVANASGISGQVTTPFGGPAASAQVLICLVTSNGAPCSTSGVTLYSDYNLSQPQANPLSTDQYGNYKTFITAGLYQVQITLAGNNQPTYIYYVAAGPANGSDYVLMHPTGNQTVTQPAGTSLTVNIFNSESGALNGTLGATTPNTVAGTTITASTSITAPTGTFAVGISGGQINAVTGYQFNSAAPSNHILLGNGFHYVDSASIPGSLCADCVLLDPTTSQEIVQPGSTNFGVSSTSGNIGFATTSGDFGVAVGHGITLADSSSVGISLATAGDISNYSGADYDVTASGEVNVAAGSTMDLASVGALDISASIVAISAPVTATSFTGALTGTLGATAANTIVGTSIAGTSMTDSGLTPGNCVQAGTAGILTTISTPCPVIPATQSDQYNIVTGCNYPDDGANESCSMSVTLGTAMADTSYIVSCVENTSGLSTVVSSNITPATIADTSHYSFSERTQGSSTEWTAHPNYGKSFVCHAHHD